MFSKLSALLLALPLVAALDINPLVNAVAGAVVQITWTASTQDPSYFSIELQNPVFNKQYAIASNVQTATGTLSITLPQVLPGGDYQLVAIAVSDVNDVLSTSGTFSIGDATTTSGSASSTSSVASSSASSGTVSTPSASTTSPALSATSPVSSVATTPASSGASTAASSTPSSFSSSGAAGFKVPGMLPAAALVLSAVAGAAMVF